MIGKLEWLDKLWRIQVRMFQLVCVWGVFVTAINIWTDADAGRPFDATHLLYGLGFLLWSGVVYVLCRSTYKSTRAKYRHDEHRK